MTRPIVLFAAIFIALSFAVTVSAQETTDDVSPSSLSAVERFEIETKDKKETSAIKDLKLDKEFRPRLPNGFGPAGLNVDAAQREKIYKLQTEYNDLIALLELRVELLKKERDVKIDAVLTPNQLQRLNRPVRSALLQR
jgi:Spy/CpxP family protein refolding chaperone